MGFTDRAQNAAFMGRVEMALAKYRDAKKKGDTQRMEKATREMRQTLDKYPSQAQETFGWPDKPLWLDDLVAREAFAKEVGDHLTTWLGRAPKAADINLASAAIAALGAGNKNATLAVPGPEGRLIDVPAADIVEHWELDQIVTGRRSRDAYPFDEQARARRLAIADSGAADIIGLIRA